MSSIQHLVSPKLPTTLANQSHVDIPGYDIWFNYVNIVYVIPTKLDVFKFEEALSRVLQLYPHASGELQCTDGCWSIELTNTAVAVDIDYKPDMSSDSLLHNDWVVQDDLSPFLNQQPVGSAGLLSLKLTFFNHETCVGVSWNHSLGDGNIMHRFMHTLSQFYQGLSSNFAAPTFEKYHFPPPARPIVAKFSSHIPHLLEAGHSDDLTYAELHSSTGHVRWRVDNHDLEELRSALYSKGQSGKFLSTQDCLIAYLVAVLNHSQGTVVQKVRSVFSYRHISAPFISENVASNLLINVPAEVPMDMAGIATAIRDAFMQCQQPDYIYGWVSVASDLLLEAANSGKILLPTSDNDLIVNSLARMDICSAHFGCPEGTQFHIDQPWLYRTRLFRPNPAKGDDGVWRTRQSIEISLRVPADLKPKILDMLARGVRYMLGKECARL